jgi:hypothetical protein
VRFLIGEETGIVFMIVLDNMEREILNMVWGDATWFQCGNNLVDL